MSTRLLPLFSILAALLPASCATDHSLVPMEAQGFYVLNSTAKTLTVSSDTVAGDACDRSHQSARLPILGAGDCRALTKQPGTIHTLLVNDYQRMSLYESPCPISLSGSALIEIYDRDVCVRDAESGRVYWLKKVN